MARPNPFKNPLLLVAAGTCVVALAAIVALAVVLLNHPKAAPPVASDRTGLQVQMGKDEKLDPAKPLRCFVNGQFVGQATLADCAAKNGVAAQTLDVGLDPSGQIAAQAGAPEPLTPLPQPTSTGVAATLPSDIGSRTPGVVADAGQGGDASCLRYASGGWRPVGDGGGLKACVHALYDDRCVRQGDALYGRYGAQTLRLVPGRVEISGDNRSFRPLVAQDPDACALAE